MTMPTCLGSTEGERATLHGTGREGGREGEKATKAKITRDNTTYVEKEGERGVRRLVEQNKNQG